MSSLTDIQQAFVHRYMDNGGIIGVRIREIDGHIVLFVEVSDASVELPAEFRELPVVVRPGRRAMLAYS